MCWSIGSLGFLRDLCPSCLLEHGIGVVQTLDVQIHDVLVFLVMPAVTFFNFVTSSS